MKELFLTTYIYKETLDETELRELTKRFAEIGEAPGVVAHYVRLDGTGGFTVSERNFEQQVATFEAILQYRPYIHFETVPITTMEDALPSILKIYG